MAPYSFSKFLFLFCLSVAFFVSAEVEVVTNASIQQPETLEDDEMIKANFLEEDERISTDRIEKGERSTDYPDEGEQSRGNSPISRSTNATELNTNITTNGGETFNASSVPSHRWPCKTFNITNTSTTVIINNETLYSDILANMNSTHGCGLLLFYSPYCEFSTNLAPLYNAVGRSYPELAVMALDTQEAMGMAARYGVVGIPTVFFFYSGRPVAKFNRSRTPASFQKFIKELSGYLPVVPLNITEEDMDGPIVTRVKESRDYYMIFSISFLCLYIGCKIFGGRLLSCVVYLFEMIKERVNQWRSRGQEKEKEE